MLYLEAYNLLTSSVEEDYIQKESREFNDLILQKILTEKQYQIFKLKAQGCIYEEIAEIFSITRQRINGLMRQIEYKIKTEYKTKKTFEENKLIKQCLEVKKTKGIEGFFNRNENGNLSLISVEELSFKHRRYFRHHYFGGNGYKTYIVLDTVHGAVKIGRAISIQKRFRDLQSTTLNRLELLALINDDYEKILHWKFKSYLIRNEWFHYSDEIQQFVVKLQEISQ